jgi:hypothetical protein
VQPAKNVAHEHAMKKHENEKEKEKMENGKN